MSEPAAAPAPKTTSLWEDFLDVFIAPAELFRRRADARFGHALLALIVLTAVIYFGTRSAMQPVFDADWARAAQSMSNRPGMTPERIESFRAMSQRLIPVFLLIGLPIGVFLLGAVIWLAGRIVGGRVNYAQGVTIISFAWFPKLLDGIARAVQSLLLDESKLTGQLSVSLGVGRFLDPAQTSPVVLGLLGRVDLFTLWTTVLVGVGLKQIGRVSTGQAAAGAAIVWVVGALPTLLQALRAG